MSKVASKIPFRTCSLRSHSKNVFNSHVFNVFVATTASRGPMEEYKMLTCHWHGKSF